MRQWTCRKCFWEINVNDRTSEWYVDLHSVIFSSLFVLFYIFLSFLQVSRERGEALAVEYGIKFMETSAKDSTNVEEAFFTLARDIKAKTEKKLVILLLFYTSTTLTKESLVFRPDNILHSLRMFHRLSYSYSRTSCTKNDKTVFKTSEKYETLSNFTKLTIKIGWQPMIMVILIFQNCCHCCFDSFFSK